MGPVENIIKHKLEKALTPTSLAIVNESHKHAGHSGNPSGAPDAETHFSVAIVSDSFLGKSLVQRHRMVYEILTEELRHPVHALSIKAKTTQEV